MLEEVFVGYDSDVSIDRRATQLEQPHNRNSRTAPWFEIILFSINSHASFKSEYKLESAREQQTLSSHPPRFLPSRPASKMISRVVLEEILSVPL